MSLEEVLEWLQQLPSSAQSAPVVFIVPRKTDGVEYVPLRIAYECGEVRIRLECRRWS